MLARPIAMNEARVNITYGGQNGDLPDPVMLDSTDGDVKQWVTEAVRTGGIPGIPADPTADFRDFIVQKFPPTDARPYNLFQVRPKTPFGKGEVGGDDLPEIPMGERLYKRFEYWLVGAALITVGVVYYFWG